MSLGEGGMTILVLSSGWSVGKNCHQSFLIFNMYRLPGVTYQQPCALYKKCYFANLHEDYPTIKAYLPYWWITWLIYTIFTTLLALFRDTNYMMDQKLNLQFLIENSKHEITKKTFKKPIYVTIYHTQFTAYAIIFNPRKSIFIKYKYYLNCKGIWILLAIFW